MNIEEILKLHQRIDVLANGERYGANHQDYKPNIKMFELLVNRFYNVVGEMELPYEIMQDIMDGQESLINQFLTLRSNLCTNKYEQMRYIFSGIDQITNDIKHFMNVKIQN